jgi:hypothetical protein
MTSESNAYWLDLGRRADEDAMCGSIALPIPGGWRCADLDPFEWRIAARHDVGFHVLVYAPGERQPWLVFDVWSDDGDRQCAAGDAGHFLTEWPGEWMWWLLPKAAP